MYSTVFAVLIQLVVASQARDPYYNYPAEVSKELSYLRAKRRLNRVKCVFAK